MTDPTEIQPTFDDIVQLLAKLQANGQPNSQSYMNPELIEAINAIVSIAFERLWPEDDPRHVTERAAAGFALGFAAGRDFEQGIAFNLRMGLGPRG